MGNTETIPFHIALYKQGESTGGLDFRYDTFWMKSGEHFRFFVEVDPDYLSECEKIRFSYFTPKYSDLSPGSDLEMYLMKTNSDTPEASEEKLYFGEAKKGEFSIDTASVDGGCYYSFRMINDGYRVRLGNTETFQAMLITDRGKYVKEIPLNISVGGGSRSYLSLGFPDAEGTPERLELYPFGLMENETESLSYDDNAIEEWDMTLPLGNTASSHAVSGGRESAKAPISGFGGYDWDTSQEEIVKNEILPEWIEDMDYMFHENTLIISDDLVAGHRCSSFYIFDSDEKLGGGIYLLMDEHSDPMEYYNDYLDLVEQFTDLYGERDPQKSKEIWHNERYKNDTEQWGTALVEGDVEFESVWFDEKGNHIDANLRWDAEASNIFLTIVYYRG